MPDLEPPFDAGDAKPGAERFDAIIVQPDHSADGAAIEAAVLALGGRIVARPTPGDALAYLERFGGSGLIVLLDVAELSIDDAADQVAAISALAELRGWSLLVAIARSQIDAVSASLLGSGSAAQLLCEAIPAEWVAALAMAAGPRRSESRVRESEAARLARLNEEVARIAEVLARLSGRDPSTAAAAGEKRGDFGQGAPAATITAPEVRDVIRARRLRQRYFPAGLLEDPAWDILLDLFAAHLERGQVSVSSLCIAAAVAPTTALRWIGKLTDVGLLAREPDPFDKRRAFVTLTAAARDGMLRYLAALQEFGLRMA